MASVQSDIDWQSTKKTVLERNSHMFNNSDMSDISFTCEGSDKILYAHKYVLGTSSAVFRAMFYGDLAEKNSIVHLSDTDEKSLEEFLRFLYTDECNLTTDNVVSVMYLSKKYIVPSLTEKCVNNLASSIKAENVMSILEQATHFDESKLEMSCWEFIKSNTKQAVASTDFNNVSQKTLASLLRLNELNIVEVELFRAVLKWNDFQCSKKDIEITRENRRSVIGDAIYDLRFLAMTQREFAQTVATSGLLTAEEIVPIYNTFNGIDSRDLKWKLSKKRSNWLNCDSVNIMADVVVNDWLDMERCSLEEASWPEETSSYDVSAEEVSSYNESVRDSLSYSAVQNSLHGGVQNSSSYSPPYRSQVRRQKGKAKRDIR